MSLTKAQLHIYTKFHSKRSKLPAQLIALVKKTYPELSDFNVKTYALQLYYDLANGSRSTRSLHGLNIDEKYKHMFGITDDYFPSKVREIINTYQQETINKWARHMKGAEQ